MEFLEKLIKAEDAMKSIGVFRLIYVSCALLFISCVMFLVLNPEKIFKAFMQYQEKQHNIAIQQRFERTPIVDSYLRNLLHDTGAARAFVLEVHNGRVNPTGLSFNYAGMTYEITRDTVPSAFDEFKDVAVDRFIFIPKLLGTTCWSGTIKSLRDIDKALAHKIATNNTYYMSIRVLYGENSEIGFLGVSFMEGDHIDSTYVDNVLRKYAAKIAINLDATKKEE